MKKWSAIAGLALIGALAATACGEGNTARNGESGGSSEEGGGRATSPARSTSRQGPGPEIIQRTRGGLSAGAFANAYPGQAPQGALQGLTVSHTEREVVPADRTTAVATFSPRGGIQGPGALISQSDVDKLRAALTSAGFASKDIDIQNSGNFGPYALIRVQVTTATRAADAKKVFDAIEASIGKAEQTGVEFGLGDCGTSLRDLRSRTFKGAEGKAKVAAEATNLKLGQVIALTESRPFNNYGPPLPDPCDPSANAVFYGPKSFGPFTPPDATPEVEVALQLTVSWALGDTASVRNEGLTITGSGKVKAKADEAYVVVFLQQNYGPFGPQPIEDRDRKELLEELKKLGYDDEDVEFQSNPYGGASIVSVEVTDLGNLVRAGRDIRNATEDVFGQVQQSGVVFTHSRCHMAYDEAIKEALADAKDRADAMASAAGRKTGGLLTLAETGTSTPYGPPPLNPCAEDFSALANGYPGQVQPFDAPAEFEVSAAVLATYAMTQ